MKFGFREIRTERDTKDRDRARGRDETSKDETTGEGQKEGRRK